MVSFCIFVVVHILNLIMQEGLKALGDSLDHIRESISMLRVLKVG